MKLVSERSVTANTSTIVVRNSLLAVCKGAGVEMTEASIVNHIICTTNTLYLQENSRFGY